MRKRWWVLAALLAAVTAGAALAQRDRAGEAAGTARPRLVVVISIDQLRADYVTRFADLYLPPRSGDRIGGFRYLQGQAWYPDCRYGHHRTVTAAGHAVIGTGAHPSLNGIVGNNWWDRASGKSMYCVADAKSQVVGATSGSRETPMSPANLLATTVGDELELATGGRSRTVAVALKDRASILMSGHRADTVIWFDEDTGGWISSSFYCPDGRLPAWVTAWNQRRLPDQARQKPWTPAVDAEALRRVWNPKAARVEFSHALTGSSYNDWITSPAGNEHTLQTARQAVTAESLGQDEIPDILSINLSSNDYVGHRHGPDSAEVLDVTVQTDRQLSEFFTFLNATVPGGLRNVTIALSADHGVVNVPELNTASGVPAGRSIVSAARSAAEAALDRQVGAADWIASTENGEFYFAPAALRAFPNEPRSRLENIVVEAVGTVTGVMHAFGRTAVLAGQVPPTGLGRRISHGLHPTRSGDVVVILDPQWLPGSAPVGTGTSHGSPFAYDTHVPLLMAGFGVRAGTYLEPVTPAHIAPALSHILGVARPSAADETLLPGLR